MQYRRTGAFPTNEDSRWPRANCIKKVPRCGAAAMRCRLMGDAAVERAAREIYSDPVMKKFIDLATEGLLRFGIPPSSKL
jgi:hypothetical protein